MRVAGEEHLVQRSFPISNNKHVLCVSCNLTAITSGMFFFVFKFYLLQKRCSLNVLNMILETPIFKVTNIIFESYEQGYE
jgi:cytochrome b subunit of formate dehydrogenase